MKVKAIILFVAFAQVALIAANISGLNSATCDYIGNGGYSASSPIDLSLTDGPVGVQIPNSGITRETMGRISDGLSQTLFFWESIGGVIIPTGLDNVQLDVNTQADTSFTLGIYSSQSFLFSSTGMGSTKSYIHSWAGLRLGNIQAVNGRVVNVGNMLGEPCSRHPGGAYAVLLDGSIRLLSRDIDPQIAFALASARGNEVAPGGD